MLNKRDIPNLLTYARMLAVPLIIGCWHLPTPLSYWLSLALVLFACITDFFDGYLARKWNAQSDIGRLLDPNADKLLIAVALILLASDGYANVTAVCIILVRELFVSGLREFMAEKQIVIHVSKLAKWKTATQMLSVLVLLLAHTLIYSAPITLHITDDVLAVGQLLLWIAAALTLITGIDYARGVWKHLNG